MLANVPPTGRDFHGLIRYLLNGSGDGQASVGRVQWTSFRNLATDNPATAANIMTATARQSIRVEEPVYQLIISWTGDEAPSQLDMLAVVERTLTDIGLDQHQAVLVAHGDTKNPHLHVALNRVSPETHRAWSTSHDYRRIERSIAVQAGAMGFCVVPGRHNGQASKQPRLRSRGAMVRGRVDRAALLPWSRDQLATVRPVFAEALKAAQSWPELQNALGQHGYVLEPKGQGFIIRDAAGTGYVKLSALGERAPGLNGRFGAFVTAPSWRPSDPATLPEPEPRS